LAHHSLFFGRWLGVTYVYVYTTQVQSHLIIFKEEKEAFVPCASHFVYRFPAVISHRESGDI
jgi:hypothetical protein